jgi:hypothetical protein
MTPADQMKLLSRILLSGSASQDGFSANSSSTDAETFFGTLSEPELTKIQTLAASHHVIMRSFPLLKDRATKTGNFRATAWLADAIDAEKIRIDRALSFLEPICEALQNAGQIIVIKSLDHWPDLGSDLDLFADADAPNVVAIMKDRFKATLAERSWGDRLASKWNFVVPGLSELVEVHVQRLGQTGEQTAIAKSLVARCRAVTLGGHTFRTAAPEDRFAISTLQRMYRHFYIRLCDVVDNAQIVRTNAIDYSYLQTLGQSAGIWTGMATYLTVIADYVERHGGEPIPLPTQVTSAARFRGDKIHFRGNFLRVPILPHSAGLYATELRHLLTNGQLRNGLRLSLLPGLATAAALEFKLTGSDKGIW